MADGPEDQGASRFSRGENLNRKAFEQVSREMTRKSLELMPMRDVGQRCIDQHASELAARLDCLTEQDLCVLYGITPGTAEAWRKRRKGPSYILAGVNYLYPRTSVAADLQARMREWADIPAKTKL